tara:strand:- start:747 stop:1070 length:324 start_codon:yes stop_codon:yes gene_type:complete
MFASKFPDEFSKAGRQQKKAQRATIRSVETATDFFGKAAQINRIMFPSVGQAAADLPPPRVNAANFPAKGYAKRKSTKADQPARARYKDLRRAAKRTRLKIPTIGGY